MGRVRPYVTIKHDLVSEKWLAIERNAPKFGSRAKVPIYYMLSISGST